MDGTSDASNAPAAAPAVTPAASGAAPPVVIVLEGLDGVGKSTVAALLSSLLDAVPLRTPPDAMAPFRARFTAGPPDSLQRRIFYEIGNAWAGSEMARALASGRHAVCDRYHASTVAYVVGQAPGELPPVGDPAWSWPSELFAPTHMVLLTLDEDARLARRAARTSVAETVEEAELRQRAALGARINEAYRRLGCVEVSAAGAPADVAAAVLARLGLSGAVVAAVGVGGVADAHDRPAA